MKGYIYKYTFSDGKVYVGQTRRHISIRHREHMSPSTGPLNPRVNGNQKCSDFGNSECSIFGIKTTVLFASAVQ